MKNESSPMDPLDKVLIDSLQGGDQKVFEVIFKSYYSRLCRYSLGIVRQREVAEDIVTDLFIKVWENPAKIIIHTSLFSYLVRSVHNASINYITREKSRLLYINEDVMARNLLDEAIDLHQPLSDLLLSEMGDVITKKIAQLPERCRIIFDLSRTEGLSHREIAHQLNLSENTVKVQIYNALSALREALKPFLNLVLLF